MKKLKSQALGILRQRVREAVFTDHLRMHGKGFLKRADPGYSKEERGRALGRNVNAFGHGKTALLRSDRKRRGQAVPL